MDRRLRTLIVDDEEPARERLRRLLQAHEDIDVIGEAVDGLQAIEKIVAERPDLVLLDIQMPGCPGTEVAASLPSPRPRIVFCTAFDEYAVEAFELAAVDYLLKPVSGTRLAAALERLRAAGGSEPNPTEARVAGAPTRFLGKRGASYHVVPQSAVLHFSSDGGQTRLQTLDGHYWMQPTLSDLEQRLDPAAFLRISRGTLLHLDAVRELSPLPGGTGTVEFQDGSRVEVSRRRFRMLVERLGR